MNRIVWILFLVLTACNSITNNNKPIVQNQSSEDFKQVTKDSIPNILNTLCNNINYEITDLYPETDTIPENYFLILDDSLKARGFVVKDWGRGNFMGGPRLLSMTLENETCTCRVDKLYYSDIAKTKKYKVTERISCNRKQTDTVSVTDSIPSFDTTTIQGKAKKLLWQFKDSTDYAYAIYNGTDTLIDINGDKQSDLLIEYYGGSGTGLKNGAEIILYDKSANRFLTENPIILSNPTFYLKTKTVVAYYIASGGGDAKKFRWNGFQLDTLEFIDVDIKRRSKDKIIVTSISHNYKTGKRTKTISDEVNLPAEYKYFDYKPIVRKE